LGADRLREKFETLASYALEKNVLREVAEQVDGLETQDSIKNLTRLLCCYQAVK
jgi:hypothetical protein